MACTQACCAAPPWTAKPEKDHWISMRRQRTSSGRDPQLAARARHALRSPRGHANRPPLHVTASRNHPAIPRPQIFPAFFSPRLVTSHHRRHHHQKNHRNKFHPDASASLLYATQQGDRVLSSFACSAKSMCHPGRPPLPPGCAVIRRRERQQAGVSPSTSAGPTRAHHYCVCSPTAHRGSFRCRWHRVGYEWGRRRPFAREGGATTARAGAEQAMYERMPAP